VQRIALAAGPCAPRPNDVFAGDLARELRHGLVVAKGIEIVFVESAAAIGINSVERRGFSEIDLDGSDAHLEQTRDFLLVPLDRCRVGEVQHGVLILYGRLPLPSLTARPLATISGNSEFL